ncbi:AzlC family ABC transporter permease [Vibrio hannami]|uniref:AzlC family ABC transporter permease n=1 Tax=Vibrio hannami TaxID=2717094 RepID=UPI0024108522|nr:AzlC family ABC transporter permease [Vibrio hannami]MDG3085627.1 AzlC family ABC transporter permease [Vibrio hannami]
MSTQADTLKTYSWIAGFKDALPLMGGYVSVAVSFGVISLQSGFSVWETIAISALIYAGASQFLFVAMVAAGAPVWLVITLTLLINARHVVYGPNLAPYINKKPWWLMFMHGLTDQVFALAHTRLPQLYNDARLGWFIGASLIAWVSWVGGTALGAIMGGELIEKWPLLGEVLPFALPSLFLVLLAPRFDSVYWSVALGSAVVIAMVFKLVGYTNVAIPLAAVCGTLLYYVVRNACKVEKG